MSHIIRTSDRLQFKKCRRSWDLGSKIRQNYEPLVESKPLAFGTAIHSGLEAYYDPDTWTFPQEVKEANCLLAFRAKHDEQKKAAFDLVEEPNDIMIADFEERLDLGVAMLQNYFTFAPSADDFTPAMVEIEFEVELGQFKGEAVFYQGRIDVLLMDKYGKYWIMDHKTAGSLTDTRFLDLDEQCGSYCWALQIKLGIRIEGVIYNELLKSAPHPPEPLKRGGFSQNKQQNTTYELYLKTLEENGININSYEGMLEHLKEQGNKFIRRTPVYRSQKELENLGKQIVEESLDMLESPRIYPNPNKFTCNYCDFRSVCLAMNDGSDYQWMLNSNFKKRDKKEENAISN